jgi:probable phosphoglycerate mutase
LQLHPCPDQGLSEIGVGAWEGRYWKELSDDPVRRDFYSRPSEACPPGGETLCAVQARAVAAVERAGAGDSAGILVAVSHADVIRSIIAHYLRLEFVQTRGMNIDHASVTALDLNVLAEPRLLFLNFIPPGA